MQDYKVIEVKRSIFEDNDADAARLRDELKEQKTFLLNLMSSTGSRQDDHTSSDYFPFEG